METQPVQTESERRWLGTRASLCLALGVLGGFRAALHWHPAVTITAAILCGVVGGSVIDHIKDHQTHIYGRRIREGCLRYPLMFYALVLIPNDQLGLTLTILAVVVVGMRIMAVVKSSPERSNDRLKTL